MNLVNLHYSDKRIILFRIIISSIDFDQMFSGFCSFDQKFNKNFILLTLYSSSMVPHPLLWFIASLRFCPVLSGFNRFKPGFVHCPVQNQFWTDKTQPWFYHYLYEKYQYLHIGYSRSSLIVHFSNCPGSLIVHLWKVLLFTHICLYQNLLQWNLAKRGIRPRHYKIFPA